MATTTTVTAATMATTALPTQTGQFVSRQTATIRQHAVPNACFVDQPPKIESFPRGYPSLSAFLSSDKDFSMFRCFTRLHARILLRKQDELIELEQKLDELDKSESQTTPYSLTSRRRDGNTERKSLLDEIEAKLKEYNTLLDSFLHHLERPKPKESHIKSVINWVDGKKPLTFAESMFLNDWSDLRRPKDSVETGGLEAFLGRCAGSPKLSTMTKIFSASDCSSKSDDPSVRLLQHSKIMATSRALTTFFAVFTLIVPVAVLYSVDAVTSRLWVIAGFTTLFSSTLCWLTSTRNYEIFSATAAYCAVMVVFVGSLPGS